ncbi:hypothetical protein N431DRAFT_92666 [Stipitochalara longipes BDJ]|nr:hypothetical protein N431DRAFT_92666 [Stipitochalara longipes BDJ]
MFLTCIVHVGKWRSNRRRAGKGWYGAKYGWRRRSSRNMSHSGLGSKRRPADEDLRWDTASIAAVVD